MPTDGCQGETLGESPGDASEPNNEAGRIFEDSQNRPCLATQVLPGEVWGREPQSTT